jgi:hypothetical protein
VTTRTTNARQLECMLVDKQMIYLLGISRSASWNRNIDRMEIADIHIDQTSGRNTIATASRSRIARKNSI